jgi:hypothetical protein
MNKSSFCSRIYVYVSYDPAPFAPADTSCLVNIANASGTSIGGGYLDGPAEVADCLTAMGCSPDRLPRGSPEDDFVRVLTNVRPRDLDAALALLD